MSALKNKEKTWFQIVEELRGRASQEAWFYVTALRGPDQEELCSPLFKKVFTCPLRAKGDARINADNCYDFPGTLQTVVLTFRKAREHYRSFEHYFAHVKFAWYALGRQDIAMIISKLSDPLEDEVKLAKQYVEKVKEWLESHEAFQEVSPCESETTSKS